MNHLKGYTKKELYSFHGENLSEALGEAALWCAGREATARIGPEFHLSQQYDVEVGEYIVYIFELES